MKVLIAFSMLAFMINGGFGLTELEQLAKDRPQLLTVIHPGDELWMWLDAKFSNTLGCKVHWVSSVKDFESFHTKSLSGWSDSTHPEIEIAQIDPDTAKPITGNQVLLCLMFELLNLEPRDERQKLYDLAANNKISEDDFVKKGILSEYRVAWKLKMVSKTTIEPFLSNHHQAIPLELQQFLSFVSEDPDAYLKSRMEHPDEYLENFRDIYRRYSTYNSKAIPTPTPTPPPVSSTTAET